MEINTLNSPSLGIPNSNKPVGEAGEKIPQKLQQPEEPVADAFVVEISEEAAAREESETAMNRPATTEAVIAYDRAGRIAG